jgi:hypothetical protein
MNKSRVLILEDEAIAARDLSEQLTELGRLINHGTETRKKRAGDWADRLTVISTV